MDIPALVGALIQAIYTFILTLLITVIQVITWPLNELITSAFPNIADIITNIGTSLTSLLVNFTFVLSFIPRTTLFFIIAILGIELTLIVVFQGTYVLAKVWFIIQKIKFW